MAVLSSDWWWFSDKFKTQTYFLDVIDNCTTSNCLKGGLNPHCYFGILHNVFQRFRLPGFGIRGTPAFL